MSISAIFLSMISRCRHLFILLLLASLLSGCTQERYDYFQGYVEGEYILVASPLPGRLESLEVRRGQQVSPGEPLFILEHAREEAEVAEAAEGIARAENILADLLKGKRPSEIAAIEARLAQARTSYSLSRLEFERRQSLFDKASLPKEQLDRARTEMERNSSLIDELSAELQTAKLTARSDLVAAARTDLDAAKARLQQARWQLDQKNQKAQAQGLVFDTFFQEGEFVPAGYPVVSILPPANIKIRFFVPETVLGQLSVGGKIFVSLDGSPTPISAEISYISPTAEFTPPVIYSRNTRSKLVFMIEAEPDAETAGGLHPGQPVDIRLELPHG